MDLKIKDVADLLNVSESTIRRWLVDGKIPAYKIHHQYRFSRFEIENWVMDQKLGLSKISESSVLDQPQDHCLDGICESEEASGDRQGRKQFSLYRAIHKGGVYQDIPGSTKEQIIRGTMRLIANGMELDPEVISDLLLDRENLQPTALNHGIGIPHARECLLEMGDSSVTVVFPEVPIPYGALDGQPVHTLFFLFAGDDKRHLHLLAKIAHLSSLPETVAFFRSRPSKNSLLDYIKTWESNVMKAPV